MPESSTVRLLLACDPALVALPANGIIGGHTFQSLGREESADRLVDAMVKRRADILLLDVDRDTFDAYAISRRITSENPEAIVILISSRTEPEALRSAMLAGAEEYLIKPLQPVAVHEALVSVWEIRSQKRRVTPARATAEATPAVPATQGIVIGVLSGKGGIGKTTISVNLALTLLRDTKKRVALVGLESGDATVLLNVHPRGALSELIGQSFDQELLEQYSAVHASGLSLFLANIGANLAARRFVASDSALQVINVLRRSHEYVIVDFPQLIDQQEMELTQCLDHLLVISSSWDLLVLRNTKQFLDMLPEESRERARIVLNRSDRNDMIQMDDIKRALQREVAMAIQNDSRIAPAAVNTGNPFVLTHPQAPISQDIAALARLVAGSSAEVKTEGGGKRRFLFFS